MEEKKNIVLQIQSIKQGVKINNILQEIKKEIEKEVKDGNR